MGGNGQDTFAAGNNNLIVADGAIYDTAALSGTYTAYQAILTEWSRSTVDVNTRYAHIAGTASGGLNGTYTLTVSTLHTDSFADIIGTQGSGSKQFGS